jgi:hypothetical protein
MEMRPIGLTNYEQGLVKGREEGQRQLLLLQLEKRFGPLSKEAIDRLTALSATRLLEMGEALITAKSLKELGLAK